MIPTHCEYCGCLRDDHTPPEEVDDGIPFAIMANGGDPEIVTCGDCADCYADPKDWEKGAGWFVRATDALIELRRRNVKILEQLQTARDAHYWPTKAWTAAIEGARESGAPTIRALVTHWDNYDGAPDSGWNPQWDALMEAAEGVVPA